MIITISRNPAYAGSRDAFLKEVQYFKGVGPLKAGQLYDKTRNAESIIVSGEEEQPDMRRVRRAIAKGMITADDLPAIAPINPVNPVTPEPIMNNPTPVINPAPANPGDAGAVLGSLVLPYVQQQVQRLVDEAVGARVPREIVVKIGDRPAVEMGEHAHPMFEKVLRLVSAKIGVMLVGPAGCGKTHLFSQVCKALGKEGESISLSGGVTEAHLTGRLLPTGDGGRFVYTESPFVKCYREGRPFLLDEMDGGDPNVLLSINQATANGGFHVEARAASGLDTYVKRHAETILMATANTYGTGAGAMYVGRNQLDAATLDRWYVVQMDYDKAYEERCAPSQVTHFVWRLRELITANKWRRVASTRMIQKAGAALGAGLEWQDVKNDLLSGFTADERSKINF